MKVNVISFLNPHVYNGGGEMISRALLKFGSSLGHEIKISSCRPHKRDFFEKPDLSLFIDVYNSGHTFKSFGAWRHFPESFIQSMMSKAPFVHMTNAYTDVCNLPYIPCSGNNDKNCCEIKSELGIAKKFLIKDLTDQCFSQHQAPLSLYKESSLNVFLSPLHKKISEGLLSQQTLPPSHIVKPMIDTNRFFNKGLERDIDYLFVGIIGEAKGLNEIRERFRNENIWLIGKKSPDAVVDFGTYLDHVPYDAVATYMNRAKNFVFLPRWPEPQGRVVAEAALCGCNIIGNENIGALSFEHDLSNPDEYKNIEFDFWKRLENIIQ